MATETRKPRRAVAARRLLALGASAAVLGTAADATPTSTSWLDSQGLVHRIAAEGEGAEGEGSAVEAEGEGSVAAEGEGEGGDHSEGEGGEGEAGASAEGEGEVGASGEGEGEATPSTEGEGEGEAGGSGEGEAEGGGSGPAPAVAQGKTLLIIDGLLGAAEDLRAAGETGADELIEEAAETAEHALEAPLAEELYESIKGLKATETADGFATVRERITTARTQETSSAALLEALPLALRAAAKEYGASVSDGAVTNRTGYLEALGIYRSIHAELESLAGSGEAAVTEVAEEMLAHLEEVEPAFSGLTGNDIATPDASLLHGAAARMELAALKQR